MSSILWVKISFMANKPSITTPLIKPRLLPQPFNLYDGVFYRCLKIKIKKKGRWAPVAHPVILATQEAEIRRITVRSQPRQILL
jgi:hypothetical protein